MKRKNLKRGSYWKKHRNNVSRWLENVVANLRPKKKMKSKMYDTVEEAFRGEKR